jgi:hypothetical protein
VRGGGCRHGSGVLWVRGSDCWAAAGGGGTVVADTVVAAISDAAGKAVPAGVAEQALPKPYVPGAGDKRRRGRSTASGQRSNGSR